MVDSLVGVLLSTRYRIIGRLGSGETGAVWDAHDERLNLSVAIKELRLPESASDEQRAELLDRAKAEARHTGQLAHWMPGLVGRFLTSWTVAPPKRSQVAWAWRMSWNLTGMAGVPVGGRGASHSG